MTAIEELEKLATRHARAIEALRGLVTALAKLYVHADRREDEDTIMDASAAARAVLEESPPTTDPRDALLAQAREALDLGNQYCLGDYGQPDDRITAAIAAIDAHLKGTP